MSMETTHAPLPVLGGRTVDGSVAGSLQHARHVLRRRWPWLVASSVVVCAVAIVFSAQQTKLFSASSEVYLSQQNLADALSGISSGTVYDTATLQRMAATQAIIADSTQVATGALALAPSAHLTPPAFLAQARVNPNASADILVLSDTNHDPHLAVKLANAFAHAYISYRLQLDTSSISNARGQIDAQIARLAGAGQAGSTLYSSLESKSEQLQTLQALETSNATVIQPAAEASQVQPRLLRNTVLGLLLGVVIGLLFMVGRELTDTRLRSESDIAAELDLPLVGRVGPPPGRLRGANARPVMLVTPQHASAEAYRVLRANLDLSLLRSKVLLVTSAVASEGKSTTAVNLAIAWARVGKRVLLIDLDLRRSRQSALLGVEFRYGIADVIRGTATVAEAEVAILLEQESGPDRTPGTGYLGYLSAGSPPVNVGEFLALPEISSVLASLRERRDLDLIIVDSPPTVQFSDATSIARAADAVLVVARQGTLRRNAAREFQRVSAQWELRRIGFVLTGSVDPTADYGGRYARYGSQQRANPSGTRRTSDSDELVEALAPPSRGDSR